MNIAPLPTSRPPGRPPGFTLVEMLLVLVILSVLAGLVYPRIAHQGTHGRVVATHAQIAAFRTALSAFELENSHYPATRPGLADLVQRPREAPHWHGPYLETGVPRDPWGHDYLYECPGRHHPDGYDLSSSGPDGVPGTADDISNWETDPAP